MRQQSEASVRRVYANGSLFWRKEAFKSRCCWGNIQREGLRYGRDVDEYGLWGEVLESRGLPFVSLP